MITCTFTRNSPGHVARNMYVGLRPRSIRRVRLRPQSDRLVEQRAFILNLARVPPIDTDVVLGISDFEEG